jgi:hypothetical protein
MAEQAYQRIGDYEGPDADLAVGRPIIKREQIANVVDFPLVAACELLYDLNIQTTASTANAKNVGGLASISIAYDSLSHENQAIADRSFRVYKNCEDNRTSIDVPIESADISMGELSDRVLAQARKFQKQALTWTPVYNREEASEKIAGKGNTGFGPESLREYLFYDEENDVFFISEEHYHKLKETPKVFGRMVAEAKARRGEFVFTLEEEPGPDDDFIFELKE